MAEVKQLIEISEPSVALTPMAMLDRAIAEHASVEVMERLMALQERWERNQGRKAFDDAIAKSAAAIPIIIKNKTVSHGAGKASYKYEDMAEISRTIDPILSDNGLYYRFRTSTEGDRITVTCVISHRGGHSEENTLSAAPDVSGAKNAVQAIGSTVTYLQRYTLKAALGLAASADDDAGKATDDGPISAEHVATLEAMVKEIGGDKADKLRMATLNYFKAETFADIAASEYDRVVAALNKKKAKKP